MFRCGVGEGSGLAPSKINGDLRAIRTAGQRVGEAGVPGTQDLEGTKVLRFQRTQGTKDKGWGVRSTNIPSIPRDAQGPQA